MSPFRRSRIYCAVLTAAALLPAPFAASSQTPSLPAAQRSVPSDEEVKKQLAEASDLLRQYWGAVMVVRNGKVLFADARGNANMTTGERNGMATRFNLASSGKLLTRIAILQLDQAGKLSLDSKVGSYLPDYPNREVRDKVTVRQLFAMQSGMGSYWNDAYEERRQSLLTIDDYIGLFANDPLAFEPGTKTLYSNAGYIVLGKIVEAVSGMSYSDFVRERILAPAGMTATDFDRADALRPGTAIGYAEPEAMAGHQRSPAAPAARVSGAAASATSPPAGHGAVIPAGAKVLVPNTEQLPARGLAAGGAYSTVGDFVKLDSALRSGKLLDRDRLGLLFGKGFVAGTANAEIAGGFPGVNTHYIAFADGLTIIAFSNRGAPGASELARKIAAVAGRALPPLPQQGVRPGG